MFTAGKMSAQNKQMKITRNFFRTPTIIDRINKKKKNLINKIELREIKVKKKKNKFLSKIFEYFQSLKIFQTKEENQKNKE